MCYLEARCGTSEEASPGSRSQQLQVQERITKRLVYLLNSSMHSRIIYSDHASSYTSLSLVTELGVPSALVWCTSHAESRVVL